MSIALALGLLAPLAVADPGLEPAAVTTDPFLWLEEVQGERALDTVRLWNEATRAAFEADPRFQPFHDEALAILTSSARLATGTIRGDRIDGFWRDESHVRGVWRTATLKSYLAGAPEWEVLLDVDALDATERQNWLWHGETCATDSPRCMVGLSRGGTDAAVYREFSKETRGFVADGFVVPEAKSDVTWQDEDTLLVGTDRGEGTLTESGYPRTIVRWRRGTALSEAPVVFEGQPTDVLVAAQAVEHGKQRATLLHRARTFFETDLYVLPDDGEPIRLPLPAQSSVVGLFRRDLVALLQEDWATGGETWPSGSLVALDLDDHTGRLLMTPPEGGSIEAVAIGRTSLFVQVLDDVVGRLVRLKAKGDGFAPSDVPLPDHGAVSLVASSSGRDDVLVSFESLTVPSTLFHVDEKARVRALQSMPAFFDASDVVVEQRFATSKDGTAVPYFVMARRDVLAEGPAPTLQYGYGGFEASILPRYFEEEARPQQGAFAGKLWVARGGVLVLSNIRGGGEYGPSWHQAALKHDRQRSFDDFFAVGEALVATGVTTPAKLGAVGRSNGGLLMGVVLTQRPDLYAAIDCGVPLLDMLRFDQLLTGASWIAEFGDPDLPDDRAVLEAYSPYHNLPTDVPLPRVLFYTSTLDDRVHPGHARKMAALLESRGIGFDWFENTEGGHGGVADQKQAAYRLAVEFTYLARQLGLAAPDAP